MREPIGGLLAAPMERDEHGVAPDVRREEDSETGGPAATLERHLAAVGEPVLTCRGRVDLGRWPRRRGLEPFPMDGEDAARPPGKIPGRL